MKRNLLIVSVIVVCLLALDQIIKIYIKSTFAPGESVNMLGDWFVLEYIENQGMAFGTRFGSSIWGKLSLSLFRIAAISGILYYWYQQAKKGVRLEFLIALGLILTGATGNLIDSMFYDFIFPTDQWMDCRLDYNQLAGSGNFTDCNYYGWEEQVELRHTGFLFGNVVDMFKFQAHWPEWVPYLGGSEVFPAIWNLADACITVGVAMVFLRQRRYFPKKTKEAQTVPAVEATTNSEEEE